LIYFRYGQSQLEDLLIVKLPRHAFQP